MSSERDKCAELTSICAGNAATAIAQMLGTTLHMAPPRCWELGDGRLPADLFGSDERVTTIFADLEGAAAGPAGLILRRPVLEHVIGQLTGCGDVTSFDERALSALCELGNIAVSAAANALSEMLGSAVLPSVPRLGFEKPAIDAIAEICGELDQRRVYLVETELQGEHGEMHVLFAWVPDA